MLLLLLVLGCPKTTAPPPAPPVVPTEAAPQGLSATPAQGPPPTPGAIPPPNSPGTPPLSGRTDAVVQEGLSHSSMTFTIGADLSPLDRFGAGNGASTADLLAASLCANPTYRVTRWEGATVAILRVRDNQLGATVPFAGYHHGQEGQPDATWRVLLRLSPRTVGAEWTTSPLVDRFTSADSILKVNAFQPAGQDWFDWRAAAFEAVGPAATLEVHELSRDLELGPLADAIKRVTKDLISLDQLQQPATDTAPWGWLPPGEPFHVPPVLHARRVEGDPAHGGGLELSGRLNPGFPGWTWVRITDLQGRTWMDDLVGPSTLERVGWSRDDSANFWFQGRVPTTTPLPAQAVLEAWFLADGATAPKQVGRWAVAE